MEIEKIFNDLLNNNNSISSYVMFETLIFKVLSKFSEDTNKEFITHYTIKNPSQRRINEFDAIAPEGLNELKGATVFEIKPYRNKRSLINIRKIVYQMLSNIDFAELKIKNLILIVSLNLTEEEKRKCLNSIKNEQDLNIEIWDLNILQNIFNQYPDLVLNTIENISELVVNNQFLNSIKNDSYTMDNKKEKYISALGKCFFEDQLVLFLGAGVSRDAKIPMWDNLVSDLLVSLLSNKLEDFNINLSEDERDYIIKNLKSSNGNSPLLLARYIRQGLQDLFTETLTQILYKSSIDESRLLTSITRLCKPIRTGIGIQGVVNYNFDDLLEYNFLKQDINHRAIFREGDIPTRDELGIYHVHGFLPREGEAYYNLAKSLLVFSEEGYHSLMLDPYSWSNLIQLNYLRENTCLFIGLSLTDPNLRRLLDIASRKQESDTLKHFAILKRDLYHVRDINDSPINIENIKKFDIVNQKMQEEYYKELGLNVIWVDDYEEIPDILDKIRG